MAKEKAKQRPRVYVVVVHRIGSPRLVFEHQVEELARSQFEWWTKHPNSESVRLIEGFVNDEWYFVQVRKCTHDD
jgi:hypothetical protein